MSSIRLHRPNSKCLAAPELTGRFSGYFLEHPYERGAIAVADPFPNVLNAETGAHKQLLCLLNPNPIHMIAEIRPRLLLYVYRQVRGRKPMKQSLMDRIFIISVYCLLIIVMLLVLYPLYFVLIASFSSPQLVLSGDIWLWPKGISWRGYEKLFQNREIMQGYGNTILYTVSGTAINLALTVAAAFPQSRRNFMGRHWISGFMVFTMFFSGGLIPTYLLIKQLGLLNTYWVMVLPGAVSVWNIMLMRTFFQSGLPFELQEAAAIDGCSNLRILLRIVLPLSAPILAVMVLFYSVGHWNAYFNALIYLSDRDKYPLQLILREILIQGETKDMVDISEGSLSNSMLDVESIKYAIVIVANLPILILYPFLQKYFNKGVMVGALKG